MKQKKFTNDNILKGMEVQKKYQVIETFLYGTFNVTNTSQPSMTKANYIGAYDALNRLKMLEKVIENDIKSLNPKDIDVVDILGKREKELSYFIFSIALENYPYRFNDINKKYSTYLKVMSLEDKYPLDERKKDLEVIINKIKKTEETIAFLETMEEAFDTNVSIILAKKRELEELKVQYDNQLKIVDFETPEDFAVELYNIAYSKMNQMKEMATSKIEYLERILEV